MCERDLLRAVMIRAFEDIKPRGNRAGLAKGYDPGPEVMEWIRGHTPTEHRLDVTMSFANICDVLGWPHDYMVTYAEHLHEGRADEFFIRYPTVVLPDTRRGYSEDGVAVMGVVGREGSFRLSHMLSSADS